MGRWDDDFEQEPVFLEKVKATVETDKALLCTIDGNNYWIPKSQITEDSEVWKSGDKGTLVITAWLAEREGLG